MSRILHQPLSPLQVQYYMRAGTQATEESKTQFMMFAHASLRDVTPSFAEKQPLAWVPLLPTVITSDGEEKFLYVVQASSQIPGTFTSFIWPGKNAAADLAAETIINIAYDQSKETSASFPVPKTIVGILSDTQPVKIKAEVEKTDDFAFTAVVPDPTSKNGERRQVISLPTLPALVNGQKA